VRAYVEWLKRNVEREVEEKGGEKDKEVALKRHHFALHNGLTLLNKFHNSVPQLLRFAYEEEVKGKGGGGRVEGGGGGGGGGGSERSDSIKEKPDGYWKSLENQRNFMDSLALKLGIQIDGSDSSPFNSEFNNSEYEKWYAIKPSTIYEHGGRTLLIKYYNSSLYRLLTAVYPLFKFQPWKFTSLPRNIWKDPQHLKEAIDFLEKRFGIVEPNDWSRVSTAQLSELGLDYFISKYGGLFEALKIIHPNVDWELVAAPSS